MVGRLVRGARLVGRRERWGSCSPGELSFRFFLDYCYLALTDCEFALQQRVLRVVDAASEFQVLAVEPLDLRLRAGVQLREFHDTVL